MDFAEALQHLLSLGHESLSIKLGLRNIIRLLDQLNNPQRTAPAVQIAGTNGKGSTAVMLEAMCRAAGIRTGLYTSPHLVSITERIRFNGASIDEDAFARSATVVREAAEILATQESIYPTFFEQVTAIAFHAFSEHGVELMILETGLGGRLDATSVAGARIVALTPIGYDHQEYLGETINQIAAEKAAIITHNVRTAVIAPQPKEAQQVINARLKLCRVKPINVAAPNSEIEGADSFGRFSFAYDSTRERYQHLRLNLPGRHQLINAAVAIELAEAVREEGFTVSPEAVAKGLAMAAHPGRLEYCSAKPVILLDGAHNAAGALALRNYLDEFIAQQITMIFAAMRDKDLEAIAATLFPLASKLVLTQLDNARAANVQVLHALAAKHFNGDQAVILAASPSEALRAARARTSPKGLICVTGSLYFLGEIKALLASERSLATGVTVQ